LARAAFHTGYSAGASLTRAQRLMPGALLDNSDLCGSLGASVVVVSHDELTKHGTRVAIAAGVCIALGIASAATAIVCAAIAVQGRFPKVEPAHGRTGR
jgi:hypothetical protein